MANEVVVCGDFFFNVSNNQWIKREAADSRKIMDLNTLRSAAEIPEADDKKITDSPEMILIARWRFFFVVQ